jgi:hypothetical protein
MIHSLIQIPKLIFLLLKMGQSSTERLLLKQAVYSKSYTLDNSNNQLFVGFLCELTGELICHL